MKKKYLALLTLLVSASALAGTFIDVIAPNSGKYSCRVDGVEVSTHTTEYKASAQASDLKLLNPDSDVVCEQSRTLVAILTSAGRALVSDADADIIIVTPDPPPPSSVPEPDITAFLSYGAAVTSIAQRNETTYDAFNVNSQAAGYSYLDPATGFPVCKVTSSTFPVMANPDRTWIHAYSGEGLQISQVWGVNSDMITLAVMDPTGGSIRLVDLQFTTCAVSNARSAPFSESRFTFARSSGNEQIIYGLGSGQLRRYDTATDAFDDAGDARFPVTWASPAGGPIWLNVSGDETCATAIKVQGSEITAVNIDTGVVTDRVVPGMDELYAMAGCTAVIGVTPTGHWDIATDVFTTIRSGAGDDDPLPGNGVFHAIANMRCLTDGTRDSDFVYHFDINSGSTYETHRINGDGTVSVDSDILEPYVAGMHSSGYACFAPDNIWRMALLTQYGAQIVTTDGWDKAMALYDGFTGLKYHGGHTYGLYPSGIDLGNGAGAQLYYDQPKAQMQVNGIGAMFTSGMNGNDRYDVFFIRYPLKP